jgi:VWFA-related protein
MRDLLHARVSRYSIAGALAALLFLLAPATRFHAQGQTPATPTQAGDQPTFRAGVRLATVDAVVTDGKGRHVTDLTPADFEVVERGHRQSVRQVVYVRTTGPANTSAPVVGGLRAGGAPAALGAEGAPAPELGRSTLPAREQTSRVLAIVVDDLSMVDFRSTVDTRAMLKTFLERDVAQGDLVAILRTSGGAGTLQQFTTDRRLLAAAIERVQWVGRLAKYADGVGPVTGPRQMPFGDDGYPDEQLAASLLAEGSIGALNYAVRGVESLPGRKTVVFVSEGSGVDVRNPRSIPEALKRVIDRANRAGVVLYALDPAGVRSPTRANSGDRGSDVAQRRTPNYTNEPLQTSPVDGGRAMEQTLMAARLDAQLRFMQFDRQESLRWLAEQTGGFAIVSQNDIKAGLGRIVDDTRGYYLIGFDTSLPPGVQPDPDDVKITTPRRGLQIRARRGRFGPANPDDGPLPQPGDALVAAAMSPFSTSALDVRLTALFGHDAEGAHVRAVVDVDPSGLVLADTGGRRKGAVTLLTLVLDDSGDIVTQSREIIPVHLDAAAYDRARAHGLRYSVRLPVTRPGGYQVRAAVHDDRSDRVGTGARFVEVPKVGKDRLALSGVILTDAAAADRPLSLAFAPGTVVEYTCTVYDGRSDRTAGLATTATVLRDGKPVYTSPPAPIAGAAADAGAVAPVPFRGRLALARDQQPGAYTLLVSVEPAVAPGGRRVRPATQWVDFDVR